MRTIVFLILLLICSCRDEDCKDFYEKNKEFDLELWNDKSCRAFNYRLSTVNTLELEGLKVKCLYNYLGKPLSKTKTGVVYDLFEGLDSCEYYNDDPIRLVISTRRGVIVSYSLFL